MSRNYKRFSDRDRGGDKLNYFIEGIQGAGKSTLVSRLAKEFPRYRVFREGDYNPVELAWCSYLTKEQYGSILHKYAGISDEIEANTTMERVRYIVTYTRILTDIPGFHKDLEQFEIYNGRISKEEFEQIILARYAGWHGENQIFECSIFQNIVENQILFYEMTDDEIVAFYKRLANVIQDREFRILYLDVEWVAGALEIIRKERVDADGNEMWYPLMLGFLENCPHGKRKGLKGFDGLVSHLEHRKALELRILREVFPKQAVILKAKEYELTSIIFNNFLEQAKNFYELEGFSFEQVGGHQGGRNLVYVCKSDGGKKYVLRISALGDRTLSDYLAETEFVHYLAESGAPVADVIPSKNGRLVECLDMETTDGTIPKCYVSLFHYARGILLWENQYRYREGAPISELFYNMGKTIGAIHRLSKQYQPIHRRQEFFDKYNMEFISKVIPDTYGELLKAISERLEEFHELPMDAESYGLVHFDYSDGNYHVDYSDGRITTFDFDNCIYCWYMFDLAHLWTHGVGWCQWMPDGAKRLQYMKEEYFGTILKGYWSETSVSGEMLEKLPLFIDMVLIEGIVDEFECAAREGEEPDPEDIEDYMTCLTQKIPYAGVGVDL